MVVQIASLPSTEAVERALQEALKGRRLVCEIGIDEAFRADVLAAFKLALVRDAHGSYDLASRRFPALLTAAVATDAVFTYSAGDLWGRTQLGYGTGTAIGQAFTAALARLGLETFPVFDEQSAARYVSRILAHGGVPVYCLGDLFRLILQAQLRGMDDPLDVIETLQDRGSLGLQLDRPVMRFLCATGRVGRDFLQRVMELREAAETAESAAGVATRLGLPAYVVAEYRRQLPGLERVRHSQQRYARPRLVLDPELMETPELVLPALSKGGHTWRIVEELPSEVHPFDVFVPTGEAVRVPVSPAARWRVSVEHAAGKPAGWLTIRGATEASPAIVFRADTGDVVADSRFCPSEDIIAVAPCELSCEGQGVELLARAELGSPAWSGWHAHHLRLHTGGLLTGIAGLERLEVPVAREEQKTVRLANRVSGVTTEDGRPVLNGPPVIGEVPWDESDYTRWLVSLSGISGGPVSFEPGPTAAALSAQLEACVSEPVLPMLSLRLLGPMGAGIRASVAVVKGLSVTLPQSPLLPGESASIVASASPDVSLEALHGEYAVFPVTAEAPRVSYHASGPNGGRVVLSTRAPALRWRMLGTAGSHSQPTNDVVRGTFHPGGSTRAVLVIDTGTDDARVDVLVYQGDEQAPWERLTGSSGGARLDLGAAIGHAIEHETVTVAVDAVLGERTTRVAVLEESITLSLDALDYVITPDGPVLAYRLTQGRALTGRTIRSRSIDRPWSTPVDIALVGTAGSGEVPCSRLRPGRYIAQLVLKDVTGGVRVPDGSDPVLYDVPWAGSAAIGDIEDERELLVEALVRGGQEVPRLKDPEGAAPAAALLLGAAHCGSTGTRVIFEAARIDRNAWARALNYAASTYGGGRVELTRAAIRILSHADGAIAVDCARDGNVSLLDVAAVAQSPGKEILDEFARITGTSLETPLTTASILGSEARQVPLATLRASSSELQRIRSAPLSANGRSRGLIAVRCWALSDREEHRKWVLALARSCPVGPQHHSLLPRNVVRHLEDGWKWLATRRCPDGPAVAALHVGSLDASAHVVFETERRKHAGEFLASIAKTFPEYVETRLAFFFRLRFLEHGVSRRH